MSGIMLARRAGPYRGTPPDFGADSDPFDGTGDLASPWAKFNFGANWITYGRDGSGNAVLGMSANGITTQRGYWRPVITDSVWTIEMPVDASTFSSGSNFGIGFIMYESSSGKYLMFGVWAGGPAGAPVYEIAVHHSSGASSGSTVVSDWGPTTLRMRRNGANMEFSYNRGSGWVAFTTRAITTDFTTMFDYYGFFQQNWTVGLTSYYEIWNRIE